MAIPKKVLSYLEKSGTSFDVVPHKVVFTAFDLAQTTRRKLSEIAKTVLVKADSDYYLLVVPANYMLEFPKVKKALGAKKVKMAPEAVMQSRFKVKPGAITPFGTPHGVETVLDKALLRSKKVLFGSGAFDESISMSVKGYASLEDPLIAVISKRDPSKKDPKAPAKKKKKKKRRVSKGRPKKKPSKKKPVRKKKTIRKKKKTTRKK